jgi:hypothetical protein
MTRIAAGDCGFCGIKAVSDSDSADGSGLP